MKLDNWADKAWGKLEKKIKTETHNAYHPSALPVGALKDSQAQQPTHVSADAQSKNIETENRLIATETELNKENLNLQNESKKPKN